jgi:hypothetical protein
MRLEDLVVPFDSISDEELLLRILSIRANRLISKAPIKKPKEKATKQTTLNISAISPEMATILLEKLRRKA